MYNKDQKRNLTDGSELKGTLEIPQRFLFGQKGDMLFSETMYSVKSNSPTKKDVGESTCESPGPMVESYEKSYTR